MPQATLSLFEIPAADPDALARFFRDVFGWASRPVAWNGPRYLQLLPPPSAQPPGGGILARTASREDAVAWIDRLTVTIRIEGESLATVLARVVAAGGETVLPPTPVDGHGTYARFLDPEGNSFGLWQAG